MKNNSKNGNSISGRKNINLLALASILVFILVGVLNKVISPKPDIIPIISTTSSLALITPTGTNHPTPTHTLTSPPTQSRTSTSSLTPTHLPSVFPGTIGPYGFSVFKWINDACGKSRRLSRFNIIGVVISDNFNPIEFIFEQSGIKQFGRQLINPPFPTTITPNPGFDFHSSTVVVFEKPINLQKGEYAHVTITFPDNKSNTPWIDDLLYLTNDCPH